MGKILLVDDEPRMVTLLKSALAYRGHQVQGVTDGQAALDRVAKEPFDLVLTDLRMEPIDGMAVIAGVKEQSPDTAVVVLTAYGDVQTAVEALRKGAYHYLTKPINFDEVAHVVDRALFFFVILSAFSYAATAACASWAHFLPQVILISFLIIRHCLYLK